MAGTGETFVEATSPCVRHAFRSLGLCAKPTDTAPRLEALEHHAYSRWSAPETHRLRTFRYRQPYHPERACRNRRLYGTRRTSDIYSLGCILRELRLGWSSRLVIRKCCAPSIQRYTDIKTIKRDLHRCWLWPRRILLFICFVALVTGLYQQNRVQTQQGLQTVSDSLEVLKKEYKTKMTVEQTTTDSLRLQIKQVNEQRETERALIQKRQDDIAAAKRKIDQQMTAYGIQQMFDTVTCQCNITIPFLRIADELLKNTEEQELKDYINERYRRPWIKRMSELPYD